MDPRGRIFQLAKSFGSETKPVPSRLKPNKQGKLGTTEHDYENFKPLFSTEVTIESNSQRDESRNEKTESKGKQSCSTEDEDGEGTYIRMGDQIFYMKPVSEMLQQETSGHLKGNTKIKTTDKHGKGTDASYHGRRTPDPDYDELYKQGYHDVQKGSDYDGCGSDVSDGNRVKQGRVERPLPDLPPPRQPPSSLKRAASNEMIDNDEHYYKTIDGGHHYMRVIRDAPNYAVYEGQDSANPHEDKRNIPGSGNDEATILYGSMHALLVNEEELPVYKKEYMLDLKRALMTRRKHGCFALILMDDFAQGDDPYRLIAYSNGVIVDKPICRKGNKFKLPGGGNKLFRDIKSLVEYYSKNKVPDTNCLLLHPAQMSLKGNLVSTISLADKSESPTYGQIW